MRERLRETPAVRLASRHPQGTALAVLGLLVLFIIATKGLHDTAQTGLNGLALGSVYAIGAVGLTLVYGILKLVNFAHGDFLTFGAYMAFLVNVTWGAPARGRRALLAIVMTALLGVFFERVMWAPMRARKAGLLQLLLMSIGLAFLIRYSIQYVWGTEIRFLDVDRFATVEFLGLRIGRTEMIVILVGITVMLAVGAMLRFTLLGKRMRALADNLDLAETSGIDTSRVILYTWLFAGGLAGLAGVLAGAVTDVRPELGFSLLLAIFAAVVLGGIGDVFGALAAGIVLGPADRVVDALHRIPLEDHDRVRGADHRADHPATGHLREGAGDMTDAPPLPFAITFDFLTATTFWTGVGILAGTYTLLTLGLQLNVGYTGIVNFGQAGFMAVGAYAMAVLVLRADWSFWLAMPAAMAIAMAFGLLVGLPSLRLRADYFAIATIAAAEIVRLTAQNARGLTGGNQGLFCEGPEVLRRHLARPVGDTIEGWLESLGWSNPETLFPLLIVVWITVVVVTLGLQFITRSPWGRVLRAIREDEDAARALGKNTLAYKLQSLAISAAIAAHRRILPRARPGHDPSDRLRAAGHVRRLRDTRARRARQLLGGRGRLDHHVDAARGHAVHRPADQRRAHRGRPVHDRRHRPDPPDGVPAAGDLREQAGDGAR